MLRSSMPRFKYKKEENSIKPRAYEGEYFHRGDIVIVNDNLKHYCGELQVVLKDMPNDGERNFVGRLPENEMMILDLVPENIPFAFIKK